MAQLLDDIYITKTGMGR